MKKIFLYLIAGSITFSACKKDDEVQTYKEPDDINVQNNYDNEAIQKFLENNYMDSRGNVKPFSSTDAADDNETKLKDLNPQTTPSGAIYIIRATGQPNPGTTIGDTDVMRIMMRAKSYLASSTDGNVTFITSSTFSGFSPLDETGNPVSDPIFYYSKKSTRDVSGKPRSYYEMEGFQEAIRKFKAFDQPDSENYNLQGVIIVPSRAAYARDEHFSFGTQYASPYRNSTFIFNLQVYKSTARTAAQD
ncbi:hypothetical protein ASG31_11815 [Chryseobacterium sp. Leaf404]|uniref:hypothetical protein n=1 Tax=unclassified Chryseobacterium TaxID=2593645 RepID=UPI0006F6C4B4|nr:MULTISPECIES: hypothetical protein [unclassified Chryseobacterium]KQT17039.1 hypothetical protein ASG31_11815 [Chryseobacterium sp. Leaf404]